MIYLYWSVKTCFFSSGGCLNIECRLTSIGTPISMISWSHDHLIFNMGIPIPAKDFLYIETGPESYILHWYIFCSINSLCYFYYYTHGIGDKTRVSKRWLFQNHFEKESRNNLMRDLCSGWCKLVQTLWQVTFNSVCD